MSRVVCEFCGLDILKNQLKRHHQTIKCLSKQDNTFKCKCGKLFNNDSSHKIHQLECIDVLKDENSKLISSNLELKEELARLKGLLEGKEATLELVKSKQVDIQNIKTQNNTNNTTNTTNNHINNNVLTMNVI